MFMFKEISWWYWLATAILLSIGLWGVTSAFTLAILLCTLQSVHFAARERSLSAFPVQVRVAYLGLLLIALWPPLYFVYWIQFIGTWAMVLYGYCLLARIMSLMPWNRSEAFTWSLVQRTFLSAPVVGNIQQGLPPEPEQA